MRRRLPSAQPPAPFLDYSWANPSQFRSFDGLMEFQRVTPECLVAKGVKAEDLLSLLHLLDRILHNRILP